MMAIFIGSSGSPGAKVTCFCGAAGVNSGTAARKADSSINGSAAAEPEGFDEDRDGLSGGLRLDAPLCVGRFQCLGQCTECVAGLGATVVKASCGLDDVLRDVAHATNTLHLPVGASLPSARRPGCARLIANSFGLRKAKTISSSAIANGRS